MLEDQEVIGQIIGYIFNAFLYARPSFHRFGIVILKIVFTVLTSLYFAKFT